MAPPTANPRSTAWSHPSTPHPRIRPLTDARRAGILLHPTSLPGPYGMGDLGPMARRWLVWLESAGQSIWQVLPLHPPDGGGSPYTSPSAFARDPLLLSIDDLVADGLLRQVEKPYVPGDAKVIEHAVVRAAKLPALHLAADRVTEDLGPWRAAHPWVDDWALFRAIADAHGDDWAAWPEPLAARDPQALANATDAHATEIARHTALQWLFDRQWAALRAEAAARGVAIWGDLPIFVSGWSCDVWAHPHLFRLGEDRRPTVISGVPPDAFSPTGQRWGHPLYDVAAHARDGFRWWTDRLATLLELADAVRLDHFRGLAASWEIPASEPDATGGRWVPGLGAPLLDAMQARFGAVPLIAEDLGVITPDVETLRDTYDLPGMAVLQFGFSVWHRAASLHLPHNHRRRLVVYTGTHDNDTAIGWFEGSDADTRDHALRYLGSDGVDLAWDLLRAAWRSVADTAVVPMQDVLRLDSRARFNVPGRPEGNWRWRMSPSAMNLALARHLAAEAILSGRRALPEPPRPISSPPGGAS